MAQELSSLVHSDDKIKASLNSEKTILFSQDSQFTYRIPALLFIPPDTFLAFAEQRSSFRDEDAKCLVLRRGQMEGDVIEWGRMTSLMQAGKEGYRTMNPCPVYEQETKTVFLFFICVKGNVSEQEQICSGKNAARLCYVHSTNAGQTWSSLIDLTDEVIGEDLKNWATFAVGPGHGVQLHSGRLVIPAYVYHITARCCGLPGCCCCLLNCYKCLLCCRCIQPQCLIFYSDNSGKQWHKTEMITNVNIKMLECQVAEVMCQNDDHVLYCNIRTKNCSRAEAHSRDGGLKFKSPSLCKQLCEPPEGCQGSVVSFTPTVEHLAVDTKEGPYAPAGEKAENTTSPRCALSWLLYSHPTGKCKREDLGIYLNRSPLEEGKWEGPWILHEGLSGYSDLAVCQGPPLLFGCLFEHGVADPSKGIAFRLFTDKEIQNNSGSPLLLAPAPSKAKSCCCLIFRCC